MNISRSELEVLEVLWSESPLTVGQIIERVQERMDWHENTVKTLLNRLLQKEVVERNKDGRRFFYQPLVPREEVVSSEAEGLLKRFFNGQMQQLVAHFADHKKLTSDDIREMEEILERLKDDVD